MSSPRTNRPSETDQPYIIKPVYKALELLKTVGNTGRPLRLVEVQVRGDWTAKVAVMVGGDDSADCDLPGCDKAVVRLP